jgi:hypothetical protein
LLEEYDNYAKHARLMTSIHAMKEKIEFPSSENQPSASEKESVTKIGVLTLASSKNNISPQKRVVESQESSVPAKKTASKEKKSVRRL